MQLQLNSYQKVIKCYKFFINVLEVLHSFFSRITGHLCDIKYRIKHDERICNIVECAYTFDAYSGNIKIEQR